MVLDSFIFFRTDSYDSRLYEYENDLPGLMKNVGLYGKGVRWYALAKGRVLGKVHLSLKYSITHFYEGEKKDDHRFGVQLEYSPTL